MIKRRQNSNWSYTILCNAANTLIILFCTIRYRFRLSSVFLLPCNTKYNRNSVCLSVCLSSMSLTLNTQTRLEASVLKYGFTNITSTKCTSTNTWSSSTCTVPRFWLWLVHTTDHDESNRFHHLAALLFFSLCWNTCRSTGTSSDLTFNLIQEKSKFR